MPDTAELTYSDVENALRASSVGGSVSDVVTEHGQMRVRCETAARPEALRALKDLGFTFYVFCGGVDWPDEERFEVLDHVHVPGGTLKVTLRCDVPRDAPRLPTATTVYGGANWHERETWELFGIAFDGHPRLSRLLLPDWFEGFPLRKDYELPARVEKPWPGAAFEG